MSAWPSTAQKPAPEPSDLWWVQVKGQTYGPYDDQELQRFVAEGRIKPHTELSQSPTGPWKSAETMGVTPAPQAKAELRGPVTEEDARIANMMVWGDLPAGGGDHIDSTLDQFGAYARVAADLWVLRTIHPVAAVRAAIAAGLKPGERFLVVDASRGRLAWSNLGLDSETGLRRVWDAKG